MMNTIYTFNRYNLGDNLIFLHLCRAWAKQNPEVIFTHFCNGCHLSQLREVVQDIPRIVLLPFENELWPRRKKEAIDTWKNSGASDTRRGEVAKYQQGFWERSKNRWDWSTFTLEHHAWLSRLLGFEPPFSCVQHLLFDYPALTVEPLTGIWPFHFLIGDSAPCSGQYSEWADHSKRPLDVLIEQLRKKYSVRTTSELKDAGYTITEIGKLSQFCQHHVMVPNGPFWPTFSTHNHHNHAGRKRIVLLDNGEVLNLPHITQCGNVVAVCEIARKEGWI